MAKEEEDAKLRIRSTEAKESMLVFTRTQGDKSQFKVGIKGGQAQPNFTISHNEREIISASSKEVTVKGDLQV